MNRIEDEDENEDEDDSKSAFALSKRREKVEVRGSFEKSPPKKLIHSFDNRPIHSN